jgi:hypothetical protein
VDIAGIQTSGDLIKRMARALHFPTYFGGNWDAFLDMVTDLSWTPAIGYVVLLRDAETLLQLPSEQLAVFVRGCCEALAVGRRRGGQRYTSNSVLLPA